MKGKRNASQQRGTDKTCCQLGDLVIRTQYGISADLAESGDVPCLRMNNLSDGKVVMEDLKFLPAENHDHAQYLLNQNDVLFNRTNSAALVGKCALFTEKNPAVFASYLVRIEPDQSQINPNYLIQLLNSEVWQKRIQSLATKGVSQSNINIRSLLRLRMLVPDRNEQSIITAQLEQFDAALNCALSVSEQSRSLQSALMQQLLLPNSKTRSKFKIHSLGELFAERKEFGKPGLPTLSVTMHDGMVDREEHGRRVASELTPEQHLLARKHDIAYNMMRMWQGVSGLAPYDGLVSPAYVVLKPLSGIDPLFASYLFKLPETIRLFHRYSQGLTNDRLRLYYDQFAEIRVPIPTDVAYQERIARLLSAFDRHIEQSETLVTALRQTKAAICQKLFT
jgi:type I restriction enzyme S subunit